MACLRIIIPAILLLCAARTLPAQIGTPRTLDSLVACAEVVALIVPAGDTLDADSLYFGRKTDQPIFPAVVVRAFKGCAVGDTLVVYQFASVLRFALVFLARGRMSLAGRLAKEHLDMTEWRPFLGKSLYRPLLDGRAVIKTALGAELYSAFEVDYRLTPPVERERGSIRGLDIGTTDRRSRGPLPA